MRCCLGLLVALAAIQAAQAAEELFPRPPQLEPAIRFWTRVYTEIDTQSGFIHDSERLDVVYETVGPIASPRARRRAVDRAEEHYRRILLELASGKREGLDADARRVLALFPEGTSNAEFRRAAGRLRFQLGQADRFREGLIRSGAWRDYIADVLAANGVPRELAALPHVESSFDPTAYSKAGAAGMWQFTRSTGLRYMRIDHIVDERRDPFLSTDAAARLLRDNYEVLQSWPLAITAYNHGVAGMRRAVSRLGTSDIGVIIEKYSSRTFGFASRNFYAAFLAALDVDADPQKYFGPIRLDPPSNTIVTSVPDYMAAETLARALDLRVGRLRELNPALTELVWSGDKFVPKGFALRLPADLGADPGVLLASVPPTERYAAQQPDVRHLVRRGETLSQIAARYRVSLASLVQLNGLRSRNLIRAGQVLMLPVPAAGTPATLAEARGETAVAGGEYVVRRGDTIERIARVLGVDMEQLLRENDIRNKNLIYAGQTLRVPGPVLASADGPADSAGAADAAEGAADAADTAGAAVAEPAVITAALITDPGPLEAAQAAEAEAAFVTAELEGSAGLVAAEPAVALETAAAEGGELELGLASGEAPLDAALDGTLDPAAAASGEADAGENVLASQQAELAADPSDYSVTDGTITVQALETLGHYADWLEIRTQRLRDLNGLPFRRPVVIGQTLKLDFSRVSPEEFEQRRIEYQRRRQEAFFSSYRIEDVEDHVIRRGESVWVLAQHRYHVPVWLLRQYNPDLDLDRLAPGTIVKFPRLRPLTEGDAQVST
ncbi:MAG TPA: LysM peptidoglycan-binding domain-containing protein [Gammaproteobacteria bacterium]